MILTLLEQVRRYTMSSNCPMPEEGIQAGIELSCLDTFGMWRFIQTFMLSTNSTLLVGLETKPENKIKADVFSKARDQEDTYVQRTLYNVWDGTWYDYRYALVCDSIMPPEDNGRMYYNRLPDGSVDKHQRTYEWAGTSFKAKSLFVANLPKPPDVGEISYQPLGGERFIKQSKDYVFTEDEWEAIYNTVEIFTPPADHEAQYCQGFKLFVKRYDFDTETETYSSHDFDFGYTEGVCGFNGYGFTGTSTAFDFSLTGTGDSVVLSNPVLKDHIMNDLGVAIITSDLGLTMNPDGGIDTFGGMYFSTEDILVFREVSNVITFSMNNTITTGALVFNPDGTMEGEIFANINKSYDIGGTYTVQFIKLIADGTNKLRLEVNTGDQDESVGFVELNIV